MAFEDLLLPNATVLAGEYVEYVLGTTLFFPLDVRDVDGEPFDFSTGYTAAMTLNLGDGTNVLTFTHTLVSGRRVDLTLTSDYTLAVRSTPSGMAGLAAYVRQALVFNLIITRTADGVAVDLMRECFVIPKPAHD